MFERKKKEEQERKEAFGKKGVLRKRGQRPLELQENGLLWCLEKLTPNQKNKSTG